MEKKENSIRPIYSNAILTMFAQDRNKNFCSKKMQCRCEETLIHENLDYGQDKNPIKIEIYTPLIGDDSNRVLTRSQIHVCYHPRLNLIQIKDIRNIWINGHPRDPDQP